MFVRPLFGQLGSGWTAFQDGIVGPATSAVQYLDFCEATHDGATLSTVNVNVVVNPAHSGSISGWVPPKLSVLRAPAVTGGSIVALSSTAQQSPAPGTLTAWNSFTNAFNFFTYTCNQNNVIDRSAYIYYATLVDENGTNSLSGNVYISLQLTFTNVPGNVHGEPVSYP